MTTIPTTIKTIPIANQQSKTATITPSKPATDLYHFTVPGPNETPKPMKMKPARRLTTVPIDYLRNFKGQNQDKRNIQINSNNTVSVIDNTRTCENSTEGWNKVTKRTSRSKSPDAQMMPQKEAAMENNSRDMDIEDAQDSKPAPLKDPPDYKKPKQTKLFTTNYGTGKRWADDSSDSESEDDIQITKTPKPLANECIYFMMI